MLHAPNAPRTARALRARQPSRRSDRPRAHRLLPLAAFVTSLGNNVQLIAGALLVLRSSGTMLSVGWLFIAVAAPQVLLSPVFGRWADRYDRRRLWITADLTSAVVALALPLWLWLGRTPGPGVYGANLALAVISALFFPASAALIKERVPAGDLRTFNANYEMATQAGMLLSATIGGLFVQTFGATPLLFANAGTFLFSAACVVAVGPRSPQSTDTADNVAAHPSEAGESDTTSPAAHDVPSPKAVWRGLIGWHILLFAQSSVVVTLFNALLPKLVLGEFHRGAGTYGAVDAIGSLGFLVAGWSYKRLGPKLGDLRIALIGFPLCEVTFVFQPDFGVIGLFILVGIGATMFGHARTAARNLIMSSVQPSHAGRAFGVANGGGLAMTIAAMLPIAALTDHTDTRYGFAATSVLSGIATIACAVRLAGRRPRRTADPAAAASRTPRSALLEAPSQPHIVVFDDSGFPEVGVVDDEVLGFRVRRSSKDRAAVD